MKDMVQQTKFRQILLALFMVAGATGACATKKYELTNQTDTVMAITYDRFDFDEYNRRNENGTEDYIKEDGTKVIMSASGEPYISEILPPPSFLKWQRFYHKSGILRQSGFILSRVLVGIWRTYDEHGKLIKEVDEDAKFGKIKPQYILNFLDKERYINVKTGKGRFDEDGIEVFEIRFRPARESSLVGEKKTRALWSIFIYPSFENNYIQVEYIIDGETGEVLEKKSEKIYMKI